MKGEAMAAAYRAWRMTADAQALHEGATSGQYLENRLRAAYLQGMEDAAKIFEQKLEEMLSAEAAARVMQVRHRLGI